MHSVGDKSKPNKAINTDVKKLRRSFLPVQLFASGYGKRYKREIMKMTNRIYYHFLSSSNAIHDLERKMIKVSLLDSLNDPFELKPYLLVGPERRNYYEEIRNEISNIYGLLCFSNTWHEPLLWGHYADKHKGIVLGFEISENYHNIMEVKYRKDRLRLKWTNDIEKDKLKFLNMVSKIKYESWQYEKEYRIWVKLKDCIQIDCHRFLSFEKRLKLKEIILGSKFSLENNSIDYLKH